MASSRVGTSTSAWILRDDGSHRSTSGTANARVFPDPVRACPIKSRPAMREGIAFSWIGVGLEMFIRAIAALVVVFKGIPENRGPRVEVVPTACPFAVHDVLVFSLAIEESSWRRTLKHGRQYTGLPRLGRKERVADAPQASQVAWYWVRLARRTRADGDR